VLRPDDDGVAALSRDENLLAIVHSEHGDSRHPALRVVACDGFATVAQKWDGPGKGLDALEFSPVTGDARLLVSHERRGREELLVWDVLRDTEIELELGLPGEVVAAWYPDGDALLVVHFHQGRSTLHRYALATASLTAIDTPRGRVGGAAVRPDGTIEYSWSSAADPAVIRAREPDGTDRVLLEPSGVRAPGSVPMSDVFVDGPGGRIHALLSRPESAGDEPVPTMFN